MTDVDEAGFDKSNVAVYGFLPEWADGSQGQNLWGNLAYSNGFTYSDVNPFGTKFNYDSPALVETIDWIASPELRPGASLPVRLTADPAGPSRWRE